ncbi:hypothetical protein GLOTRDRAFT_132471 [Gloeophyllum trabeum ATCC 11539]|uniref:Uncharacterized protein n=1 Tax=Gloeophyllum trabeum (strain ATCC 11539 / FP-39264 / Madison 617) TaxID=670483 RepID=S7PYD0_GLOTA|nr:uncharacterized protein GLOTRDRAFT_132471 [Gloeophyllum trabeum ATCC 11539]EPQ52357.1 hypothetical protein GLOTRDRAFT_132471 [Gloeophyllum trabeum ATCC 11539]
MSSSVLLTIDDTNPDLHYSPGWFTAGNATTEYNGTTHGTVTFGSTMTFTFVGSAITVYGTVGPTKSTSSYNLDDLPAYVHSAPEPPSPVYRQVFYQSPVLPFGEHMLIMQKTTRDNSYLWLDFLEYNATEPSAPSTTSAPATVLPSSTSITATPVTTVSTGVSRGARAGAVAAAVIAAVAVVVTLLLCLVMARRRKRGRTAAGPKPDMLSSADEEKAPYPLQLPGPGTGLWNGVPIIRAPRPPQRPSGFPSVLPLALSQQSPGVRRTSFTAGRDRPLPDPPRNAVQGDASARLAPARSLPIRPHSSGRQLVVANGAATPSTVRSSRNSQVSQVSLPNPHQGEECPSYEASQIGSSLYDGGSLRLAGGPPAEGVDEKSRERLQ